MSAPFFVQQSSMFSGLGAERTEISEQQWTDQVNRQWAAANPGAAQALSLQTVGANLVGIGLMLAGAVSYAMGQKGIGAVLGVGGAGLVAFGFIRDRTVGYGAPNTLNGIRYGSGMV